MRMLSFSLRAAATMYATIMDKNPTASNSGACRRTKDNLDGAVSLSDEMTSDIFPSSSAQTNITALSAHAKSAGCLLSGVNLKCVLLSDVIHVSQLSGYRGRNERRSIDAGIAGAARGVAARGRAISQPEPHHSPRRARDVAVHLRDLLWLAGPADERFQVRDAHRGEYRSPSHPRSQPLHHPALRCGPALQ